MSPGATVALLGDVHGNLPALRAVLAAIRRAGIDAGVLTGDLVMRGDDPAGCVAAVRALGWPCARGNTDAKVGTRGGPDPHHPKADRVGSRAWTVNRLSADDHRFLAELPPLVRLELSPAPVRTPGGGAPAPPLVRVAVMHGGPDDPRELIDTTTPDARIAAIAARLGADVLVNGHTHAPLVRRVGGVLLVNPGAVGEGVPGDRHPRWAWLRAGSMGPEAGLERVAAELTTQRR